MRLTIFHGNLTREVLADAAAVLVAFDEDPDHPLALAHESAPGVLTVLTAEDKGFAAALKAFGYDKVVELEDAQGRRLEPVRAKRT